MGTTESVLQSLRAVDAWIDVINANVGGGVRTAYKTSRLKFAGSNANVLKAGTSQALPLQMPESSLMVAETHTDFTQGAITSGNENCHLAIQGQGFFVLNKQSGLGNDYFTRDGEFHLDKQGYLVHSSGLYLFDALSNELVWDDSFGGSPPLVTDNLLSVFTAQGGLNLVIIPDIQMMEYTRFGATVFNYPLPNTQTGTTADSHILSKSLEASNASMTQSVPELSLAQKLFSALTKVIQTSQTDTDAVINLVR